jgi:hypothetical protein
MIWEKINIKKTIYKNKYYEKFLTINFIHDIIPSFV